MSREFDDYEEKKTTSDETGADFLGKLDSATSKINDITGNTDNQAYRTIQTESIRNAYEQRNYEYRQNAINNTQESGYSKPDYRAKNPIDIVEPEADIPQDIRILNRAEKQDFSSIAQTFQQTVENNYKESDAWTGREYTGKAITAASALTYGLQAVNTKGELNSYLSSMTEEDLTGFAKTMMLRDSDDNADISQLKVLQNKEFVDDVHQTFIQKIKDKEPEGEKGISGTNFHLSESQRLNAHLGQIENYYISQGINIQTLSSSEIDKLIKGETVKGVSLHSDGEIKLLESWKKGKNIQKDAGIANAAKGRGISIGKEIISKSYEGSDFESGLGLAKSSISLAKTAVSATTVASEAIISGAATLDSSRIFKKADRLESKLKKNNEFIPGNKKLEKMRKKAVKIREGQEKPREVLQKVRTFNNKSAYGKAKVIASASYRNAKIVATRTGHKIAASKAGQNFAKSNAAMKISQGYKAVANSKAAAVTKNVVTAPVVAVKWLNNTKLAKGFKSIVSHINTFGIFLKKFIIKIGISFVAVLLVSALLLTIMTGLSSIIPSAFMETSDGSTPLGQTIMDELWGTQKAYQDLLIDGVISSAGADQTAVLPDMSLKKTSIVNQATNRNENGLTKDDAGNPIVGTPVSKLRFNTIYEGTVEWDEGGVTYTLQSNNGQTKTYAGSDGSTVTVNSNSSGPSNVEPTHHSETVQTTGPIGTHGLDANGEVVTAGDQMPSDVAVDAPTINVSYKYIDKNGRTTHTTMDGITKTYTQEDFYKAIFSMATVALGYEANDHDFYYAYVKQLFDKAYSNGGYDIAVSALEMPGSAGTSNGVQWINDSYTQTVTDDALKLTIDVTIYIDASIVDMMENDTTTNEWMHKNCNSDSLYNTENYIWEGWGTDADRTDSYQLALTLYELDWSSLGINFVGKTGSLLSSAETDQIYQDIVANMGEMTGDRESFVKAAMSGVGAFSYGWGSKVTDPNNPPSSLDCSGFVNYMMYLGGVTDHIMYLNCYGMLHSGMNVSTKSGTSWSTSELKPGDLLIKNNVNGTVAGQYNHVVIYLGEFTYNGVTGPHFAECRGGKGSIISSSPNTLKYQYRINLFND